MITPKARILVIALNGIGNTLLATPLISNLHENVPDAKIDLLVLSDTKGLFVEDARISETIVYPSEEPIGKRVAFLSRLKKRKYDVSFYPYPNVNIMSSILGFMIGARQRINFKYPFMLGWYGILDTVRVNVDLSKHDVEKNLALVRACGLTVVSKTLSIYIGDENVARAERLLENTVKKDDVLIGMHVGSKEELRIWSTIHFAAVVTKLSRHKNVKIILLGTAIEKKLISGHDAFSGQNVVNFIEKTSLLESAHILSKCNVFVGNDSAPGHIASAVGTKVVSIYLGPHIKRTAPFGDAHVVFLPHQEHESVDTNKNHRYVDRVTPDMVYEEILASVGLSRS